MTQSNGKQTAIRGGPENNNWLEDNLKVTNQIYQKGHLDFQKPEDAPHHRTALASVSD